MEKLFEQLKGYLKMDSEISFTEFSTYYQEIIAFLNESFDKLNNDELLKARFIATILYSNAVERASRKGSDAKKYKKIGEKSKFWADAINYRLLQNGMTQEQINQADQEISEAI